MDTSDFGLLTFLVQQFIRIVNSSGFLARMKHGTLSIELKIVDEKITYARPHVEPVIKL